MINKQFHAYNDKYTYEIIINKHLNNGSISPGDAKHINMYIIDKLANGEIIERRAARIATMLTQWRRFISVEYQKLTIDDLKSGLLAFKRGQSAYGEKYSDSTQRSMIKVIKPFVRFLISKKIIAPIEEADLKKIKPPQEIFDSVKPQDILTQNDVNTMIEACKNSRDRAILMTLYETGARVGEIARLTWGDLTFSEVDCRVRIEDQKVGGERYPYVVLAIPYLLQYRNDRGMVDDNDFVFLQLEKKEPITYKSIDWMISRIAIRANIKKPVTAKLFRASRITNMIKEGYQESIIKKMMWQKLSTKMFDHYLKLADTDVQKAIREKNGISKSEKAPSRSINR